MAKHVLRALAFAAVVIGVMPAIAEEAPRPIDSPECKEIVARLMEIEGTAFHGTDGKMAVFLHPTFSDFTLVCYRQDLTGVLVRFDGVHPSNTWYSLAAKAGMAVTGVDAAILENAIRKCHRDARGGDIAPVIRMPKAKIRCHVSADDTGVEIFINAP